MSYTDPVRVRFAPSPTGRLHVGNATTALFSWPFARRCRGIFAPKIDDADAARSAQGFEREIVEGLLARERSIERIGQVLLPGRQVRHGG